MTDHMELEPCPFHKSPVHPDLETGYDEGNGYSACSGGWWAEIECPICGVRMSEDEMSSEEGAIERVTTRWNTRYRRTCKKVPGKMGYQGRKVICSECGYGIGDDRWAFCPKCGAKVEADAQPRVAEGGNR